MPDLYDPAPAIAYAPPRPSGGSGIDLSGVLAGVGQLSGTLFPWFQELNRHEETELGVRANRAVNLAAVQRGSFLPAASSGLGIGGLGTTIASAMPAILLALGAVIVGKVILR